MEFDVKITKLNESFMRIDSHDRGILLEISEQFSFKAPNARFHPKVKYGVWDGIIRLFNLRERTLPIGLYNDLVTFLKNRNYRYVIHGFEKTAINQAFIKDFLKSTIETLPFKPRKYQIEAFLNCVNNERLVCLSPTGSGKSLIIYLLVKWNLYNGMKTLIIVTSTSLLSQMESDFHEYGADFEIQTIKEGKTKEVHANVVISTWQSIYKLDEWWFNQFDSIIGDECHHYKANSFVSIMSKSTGVKYKYGFTGTLDDAKVHEMTIKGYIGDVYRVTTTEELINKGFLSRLKVYPIIIKYPDSIAKKYFSTTNKNIKNIYNHELKFIISLKERNIFLKNFVEKLEGNTLILYRYVKDHGEVLYEYFKKNIKNKNVYFVSGNVPAEDRENIRKIVEKNRNAIIIASYGTFSTGINIKNLHNIVFASPTKSKITTLQSIGRGLRVSDDDSICNVFDLVDYMEYKGRTNIVYKHFIERLKIYKNEKFPYKILKTSL